MSCHVMSWVTSDVTDMALPQSELRSQERRCKPTTFSLLKVSPTWWHRKWGRQRPDISSLGSSGQSDRHGLDTCRRVVVTIRGTSPCNLTEIIPACVGLALVTVGAGMCQTKANHAEVNDWLDEEENCEIAQLISLLIFLVKLLQVFRTESTL